MELDKDNLERIAVRAVAHGQTIEEAANAIIRQYFIFCGPSYEELKMNWIGLEEAAAYLGVHIQTLQTMIARGDGPAFYTIGKRRVFLQEDLDAYVASKRTDPKEQE